MFELPAVPVGVVTLVGVFAPYLIALVNHPKWQPHQRRLISVLGSVVITMVALTLYYLISGDQMPEVPVLILLGVLVSQTSFALITGPSANRVERNAGIGS